MKKTTCKNFYNNFNKEFIKYKLKLDNKMLIFDIHKNIQTNNKTIFNKNLFYFYHSFNNINHESNHLTINIINHTTSIINSSKNIAFSSSH